MDYRKPRGEDEEADADADREPKLGKILLKVGADRVVTVYLKEDRT